MLYPRCEAHRMVTDGRKSIVCYRCAWIIAISKLCYQAWSTWVCLPGVAHKLGETSDEITQKHPETGNAHNISKYVLHRGHRDSENDNTGKPEGDSMNLQHSNHKLHHGLPSSGKCHVHPAVTSINSHKNQVGFRLSQWGEGWGGCKNM